MQGVWQGSDTQYINIFNYTDIIIKKVTIGAFGIGDSNSEFATSSVHTAYDSPSSLVSSHMSEHVSHTPPTSEMDLEVCFRDMEEELMWNQLKTDRIEAALQAILNKLDVPRCNENAMQDSPGFGIVELEMSESDGRKVEGREVLKLLKVRPATLMDFDRDCRKGHASFNTCCIYFAIVGNLFLNDQAHIHWVLSFFKSDCAACFANKVLQHKTKGKGNYF